MVRRSILNDVKKLNSSSVNQTIEGGSLYANTTFTQANYQPNLSDRNLVMPPYIQYNLFSNRLLGEIYINQTVSPTMANSTAAQLESYIGQNTGALGSLLGSLTRIGKPKVVNASRNYNYSEDTYVQLMENPNAAFSSDSALSNISSLLGTKRLHGHRMRTGLLGRECHADRHIAQQHHHRSQLRLGDARQT